MGWLIALLEYCLAVPANRIGYSVLSLGQLKILQEMIALSVFVPFNFAVLSLVPERGLFNIYGAQRLWVIYLCCGIAGSAASQLPRPVNTVGASGAISGVMGAYIVLYPHVRVFMIVPLGFMLTTMAWPASW